MWEVCNKSKQDVVLSPGIRGCQKRVLGTEVMTVLAHASYRQQVAIDGLIRETSTYVWFPAIQLSVEIHMLCSLSVIYIKGIFFLV